MRVNRVAARQAHYVPSRAYRPDNFGNPYRDPRAEAAGSAGGIPSHLLGPEMLPSSEIVVEEIREEVGGTVQNGLTPVKMLRCIDCNALVPETRTEEHICA